MKVYKGLSLSDQKVMFENLFVWNLENGEKPGRKEYKKWVLEFFQEGNIKEYINNLNHDIELSEGEKAFNELNESYKRQISFLQTRLNSIL